MKTPSILTPIYLLISNFSGTSTCVSIIGVTVCYLHIIPHPGDVKKKKELSSHFIYITNIFDIFFIRNIFIRAYF